MLGAGRFHRCGMVAKTHTSAACKTSSKAWSHRSEEGLSESAGAAGLARELGSIRARRVNRRKEEAGKRASYTSSA